MKKHDDQSKQRTEELQGQIEEWKSKYLRALADYQNLERRVSQERQEFKERITEEIIHKMLVILDDVQKAEKHVKDEGLTLAVKGFDAWLTGHNVRKIHVLHKEFNPHEMECVEVVEGDKDNEVIDEVRPGYMIGEKILRHALVKVSKKQNL